MRGVGYLASGEYQHGEYQNNGHGERIELDDFPPFSAPHRRLNPIEITRGCVYACNFCQTPFLFKARFRHRSLPNILEWIRRMVGFGCDYVRFISPTALSYGSAGEAPTWTGSRNCWHRRAESWEAAGDSSSAPFPPRCAPST